MPKLELCQNETRKKNIAGRQNLVRQSSKVRQGKEAGRGAQQTNDGNNPAGSEDVVQRGLESAD